MQFISLPTQNLKEPFCQHEFIGKTIVEHLPTKHGSSKRDLLVNSPLPNQNFRNKKIDHDLEKAIADDMTDIFKNADNVWCTQPSQESDALKLKSPDAEDPVDFLESLETVLESLVAGFHLWLTKDRSETFKTCHDQSICPPETRCHWDILYQWLRTQTQVK